MTKKQDRDKAEREAQALRRRGGAASPILEVMSKEMGVTMTTTAAQSTSTTANDARTSWRATSSTDEAARMPRGGGCAPSTSRAELADPDKAGKELLASTFSAAVWGCTTITTNGQKRQYNFNIFFAESRMQTPRQREGRIGGGAPSLKTLHEALYHKS